MTPSMLEQNEPRLREFWNRKFLVRFQQFSVVTPQELELFGMPITGDAAVDAYQTKAWSTTYLTLSEMWGWYKNRRARFRIPEDFRQKPPQIAVMYRILVEYLKFWENVWNDGVFEHMVPVDDLISLDRMAEELHRYAGHLLTPADYEQLPRRRSQSDDMRRWAERRHNSREKNRQAASGISQPRRKATGTPPRRSLEALFKNKSGD